MYFRETDGFFLYTLRWCTADILSLDRKHPCMIVLMTCVTMLCSGNENVLLEAAMEKFFKYIFYVKALMYWLFFFVSACETRQKNFDDIFLYIILRKRMKFPNKFYFACYHCKNIHLVLLYGSFQVINRCFSQEIINAHFSLSAQ